MNGTKIFLKIQKWSKRENYGYGRKEDQLFLILVEKRFGRKMKRMILDKKSLTQKNYVKDHQYY